MPLPNTKVLPDVPHHRKVVARTLTQPGKVWRVSAGPPPFPKPPGWTGREMIHETLFDVQPLQREGGGTPGEQPTTERQYTLTMQVTDAPAIRAGERGDIIEVIGREFKVLSFILGAELWQIDLVCSDNLTQQNPE